MTGTVCSVFTFVAYKYWRKSHAIHHATHAELEERGTGDVWTMTVDEYLTAPKWKKIAYRVFRNPWFLFTVAPTVNFLILERFPLSAEKDWHNGEKASVWWTNLALLVIYGGIALLIGFWNMLAITVPIMIISSSLGVWMFYVQHQYERTYWEHTPEWNYTLAAMRGSSYYRLPRVMQWFTGNIGFHHIHHLSPRIPNYNLERCHKENELMQRRCPRYPIQPENGQVLALGRGQAAIGHLPRGHTEANRGGARKLASACHIRPS
ncbi:MAG: fatty acid desaturase [Anaerolineales bacterium]|nr:fatty acid desaturase [Anaerolineales bacterium]